MQVVLRTAFQLSGARIPGRTRAAILIDAETGVTADAVTALLRTWRTWLTVTDVTTAPEAPDEAWLGGVAARGADVVAIVSERPEFVHPVAAAAEARGLPTVYGGYETASERDRAFLHEMAHHHYELGGLNEWDAAPVQYAIPVLQSLSASNCIRHFPQYMIPRLRERSAELGRPLEALDVGSGSVSRLRWGALQGLLRVTGVDPLLDLYDVVLAHHGLDHLPSIRVDRAINANAEDLDRHVAPASFDFAYCCNALDHVEDPQAVVGQVARSLRPGGSFALQFVTREGSRQGWQQLHQFDLYLDPDRQELMCARRDAAATSLVPAGSDVRLAEVVVATDDYTVAVLSRPDVR